jgi:uncharacterized protein YlxW (UPF0749 family)
VISSVGFGTGVSYRDRIPITGAGIPVIATNKLHIGGWKNMQVQYVSDKTHKVYASEEECKTDEAKYDAALKEQQEKVQKLKDERAQRAKEVDDAYKAIVTAQNHYDEVLNRFLKDYGSYHTTISTYRPKTIEELFNEMCSHLL